MNKAAAFITDLFFPNRCPICREFIKWNDLICDKCENGMKPFPSDICPKCGKVECICGSINYDKAVVCFHYENPAKTGILSLKDGHKEFGCYIGIILGDNIKNNKSLKADCVIPVPMSKGSYRKRRYNQAEVIAEQIAKINNIPLMTDIIYKYDSAVQHSLSKEEREKNTAAYYGSDKRLDNMKIILCDDVITTGSTMNRCAEILKEMGAAEIYAAAGTTTKLKRNE